MQLRRDDGDGIRTRPLRGRASHDGFSNDRRGRGSRSPSAGDGRVGEHTGRSNPVTGHEHAVEPWYSDLGPASKPTRGRFRLIERGNESTTESDMDGVVPPPRPDQIE